MILLGRVKRKLTHANWHDSVYMQVLKLCLALKEKGMIPDEIVYQKGLPVAVRSLFKEHLRHVFGKKVVMRTYGQEQSLDKNCLLLLDDATFQAVAQRLMGTSSELKNPRSLDVSLWHFEKESMHRILPVSQSAAIVYQRRAFIAPDRPSVPLKYQNKQEESLLMYAAKDAATDYKMGLPNFRMYSQAMTHLFKQKGGCPGTLLLMDLDDFRKINNQYGYDKADLIIEKVGRVVQGGVRQSDMVCRFGGDEVVVYCVNATPEQVRDCVVPRLRQRLNDQHGSQTPDFTVSFGISGLCRDNYSEAMAEADAAVRLAKKAKNSTVIYDETDLDMRQKKQEYYLNKKVSLISTLDK